MDWTSADSRTGRWRESLRGKLQAELTPDAPTALALLRLTSARPGGTAPSLIEQEGLLARAMACVSTILVTPCTIEPLSLNSLGLILPHQYSTEVLEELAGDLALSLEKYLTFDTAFQVRVSIGIAVFPHNAEDPRLLIDAADAALGSLRPGQVVGLYSEAAEALAIARGELTQALQHAAANEQFRLHYQPQLDPRSGRFVAAEALVRWQRDADHVLLPDDFFPYASGQGFFDSLVEWTLSEALRQLQGWRSRGIQIHRVAVNLSPHELRSDDLFPIIESALRRSGCEPEWLELELTETHLVENMERCRRTFEALRELGVRIAIDDFGAGYSSLSYLRDLPVDTLKLDRSLTADVVRDPTSATIVSAVAGLAAGLQLTSVGEGVEREDQFLCLASLGCALLQGYWIAKPAPADELAAPVHRAAGSA